MNSVNDAEAESINAIAQIIYEMSPCGEQPVDVDGRPTGPGGEIPWTGMSSYDPAYYDACIKAAKKIAAILSCHRSGEGLREAQHKRRVALVERLSYFADMLSSDPIEGEKGDVANDLLREAAAQIASDDKRLRDLPRPSSPHGQHTRKDRA